jgi:hypothetical protein
MSVRRSTRTGVDPHPGNPDTFDEDGEKITKKVPKPKLSKAAKDAKQATAAALRAQLAALEAEVGDNHTQQQQRPSHQPAKSRTPAVSPRDVASSREVQVSLAPSSVDRKLF